MLSDGRSFTCFYTVKCEELRLTYHMTLHACVGSDSFTENRVVVQGGARVTSNQSEFSFTAHRG